MSIKDDLVNVVNKHNAKVADDKKVPDVSHDDRYTTMDFEKYLERFENIIRRIDGSGVDLKDFKRNLKERFEKFLIVR